MPPVSINLLAVLVAAIVSMIIGAIWYGVFSEQWLAAVGKKKEDLSKSNTGYMISSLTALVTAYVLAHFVDFAEATSVAEGAATGFWVWLGFIATFSAMSTAWEEKSWNLWLLNNGHQLVTLVVSGIILAVWA